MDKKGFSKSLHQYVRILPYMGENKQIQHGFTLLHAMLVGLEYYGEQEMKKEEKTLRRKVDLFLSDCGVGLCHN